jgi:3-dehydroquinate dehydratase/shikimate dehydrogenase
MICISIAQESRRLALADMLNASRQCDLLEVRLDRFGKAPEVGELLQHKPKPIILSCRRPKDGGAWDGSEEERLAILRQCIVSKADYVEIELDVADQIRKFPPAKRVISYTNLEETPANIADFYAQAQTKSPDVIKLVTRVRTPEEAWPLLQILAKPAVPTVAVGLGKPGVMLNVLGRKIGAPWIYAALERGMEAYPEQPTIQALREVYHYEAIGRSTRLIGVTGFGEREVATVAAMNAALARQGSAVRCLPLALGSVALFRKIINAVHLMAVVVDEAHGSVMTSLAAELDASAQGTGAVDLLLPQNKDWIGHNTQHLAVMSALETMLGRKSPEDRLLQGRIVLLVGTNPLARALAQSVQQRGGVLVIASHQRDAAQRLAQAVDGRHIQFEALYTTMHDVLIVCDEKDPRSVVAGSPDRGTAEKTARAGIHAGYLKPGMTVVDLTAELRPSVLLREAQTRGCKVVTPQQVLGEQIACQLERITGEAASREAVAQTLAALLEDVG